MGTKIEWAEETWNPIIGCSKVSPGCQNCYAERMANRLASMKNTEYHNVIKRESPTIGVGKNFYTSQWNGKTHMVESALEKPLHWKKPRTIFVCSMGDLFHSTISFKQISKVFSITQKCPQHTFLILTKRPATMWRYFQNVGITKPYLNVWLGVTVENQEQADKRIPILLSIPAVKRFVSIEPMLGPVDIKKYVEKELQSFGGKGSQFFPTLDWVICGSESGPVRRYTNENWVRDLKNQCVNAEVPFLLKQLHSECDGKKIKMPWFDGQVWNQKPES